MNIRASKILRNLGIAAFHMGFLLKVRALSFSNRMLFTFSKGNLDLPEEFEDLITAIKG